MELLLPLFRWKKYLQESESIFLRIISIQGIQCKSAASASESNLEQIKGVSKMIWSLFQQLEFGTEGDQSILNTTWYPHIQQFWQKLEGWAIWIKIVMKINLQYLKPDWGCCWCCCGSINEYSSDTPWVFPMVVVVECSGVQSCKLYRHLGTRCPVGLGTSSRILRASPAFLHE